MPFGAFVEFLPGKDGLLHISEISWERIETMDGIYKEGDQIDVKLVEVDPKTGKFRLSVKALLPRPEGMPEQADRPRREDRGDRGDRRGPRDGNRDRGPREERAPREPRSED
jgi:polyribonucleotide nucleotidyltransferase